MAVFDDGTGPALYAAGLFTAAGGGPTRYIAKWDGSRWSPLANGTNYIISALAVYDDGTGPALYAGGNFWIASGIPARFIAKWDGSSWSAVGGGITGISGVNTLAVYDDGTGPALYAGGSFSDAGGVPTNSIAKWNGSAWSALGNGTGNAVRALTVFDDGSGPALYACGDFRIVNGAPGDSIAKWDGTSWSQLASGIPNGDIHSACVFDDGSGPELYVGGTLGVPGSTSIAKWNGTSWSGVGGGMRGVPTGQAPIVAALNVYDDGNGRALYAGGIFATAGGVTVNNISKWDGSNWSPLASGVSAPSNGVSSLCNFDDGHGSKLQVGGFFTFAGGVLVNRLAAWDGSSWSSVGSGLTDVVTAVAEYDDGNGPALYVGGYFTSVGGVPANHIAKWNGSAWSPVGTGTEGFAVSFAVFDDGSGPSLFAATPRLYEGGLPAHGLVKWNGASWSFVPGADFIEVLSVFDDGAGPELYAGGEFGNIGAVPAARIAKWDGTIWSALGSGVSGSFPAPVVHALHVFDDGSGPALYVGGIFNNAGAVSAQNIARWKGTSWSALGGGTALWPDALVGGTDAGAPVLFASSANSSAVMEWNGSTWLSLPSALTNGVPALAWFDDGSGAGLYAGGTFAVAGGGSSTNIARWDGMNWNGLGSGLTGGVRAMSVFHDGNGLALAVGGEFTTSPAGDSFLAIWGDPCNVGTPYCFGDGSATACPCANFSNQGDREGCLHSLGAGGSLVAKGTARISADSITLIGSLMPNGSALYIQGTAQVNAGFGSVFGDGLRCAGGTVIRMGAEANSGGSSQFPGTGDPSVSVRGLVVTPGTRTYQVWYRNAALFCTPSTFNLTNGLSVTWGP